MSCLGTKGLHAQPSLSSSSSAISERFLGSCSGVALLGPWVSPGGGQASTDRARETEGIPSRDGGSLERSGGEEEQTGRGRKLDRREGDMPRKGQNTGQGRRGGQGSMGSVGGSPGGWSYKP